MKHGILLSWSLVALLALPAFSAEPPARPARPAVGIAPPERIVQAVADVATATGTPVATAALPARLRRAVVADAARRFQVAENAVVLTRAEQVTWPDGSMGCPLPGRMYTQALVPGYRLVAKTAQGEMLYHTDTRGNLASCAAVTRKPPHEELKQRTPVEPETGPPPTTPDR